MHGCAVGWRRQKKMIKDRILDFIFEAKLFFMPNSLPLESRINYHLYKILEISKGYEYLLREGTIKEFIKNNSKLLKVEIIDNHNNKEGKK
jgi:hypothetical protein